MIWARDKKAFYRPLKLTKRQRIFISECLDFLYLSVSVSSRASIKRGAIQRALLFSDPQLYRESVAARSPSLGRVIKIKIYKHFFPLHQNNNSRARSRPR